MPPGSSNHVSNASMMRSGSSVTKEAFLNHESCKLSNWDHKQNFLVVIKPHSPDSLECNVC
eukprot:4093901-Amphidinium_carterae.1